MKNNSFAALLTFLITAIITGGCSTGLNPEQPWCAIGGGAVGALAGLGINAAANGDDQGSLAALAIGAPTGAVVGSILCNSIQPPKPEPLPELVVQKAPVVEEQPQRQLTCLRDDDRDGIKGDSEPGCLDKCPNTPAGVSVDGDGCPKVGETLITLRGINFALNSSDLTASSKQTLDKGVKALNDAKNVKVRIAGHTDNLGPEKYNIRLSSKRANAVMKYLAHSGIAANRLEAVGYGETRPISNNKTEDGRGKNRRVEFIVVSKQ